jgi:hypothetical protein
MNGTSGFQEVRSSPSRSPSYRLLDEQQHQFGTGSWHFLHTHDPTALSQASAQSEKSLLTIFSSSVEKANGRGVGPGIQGIGLSDGAVQVKRVHVKRGGSQMKTGTFFLLASLMLVGLLLAAGSAAAWSGTDAHFATSGNCASHVTEPTHTFVGSSFTFNLCRANSQATKWRVQMLNYLSQPITTCSNITPPSQLTAVSTPLTFTCTGLLLNKTTQAKVFWVVGASSEMQHTDNFKRTQ